MHTMANVRFARDEPVGTVSAVELERDHLHSINDGFVSGGDTRQASEAVSGHGCEPIKSAHGLNIALHVVSPSPCAAGDALCELATAAAGKHGSPPLSVNAPLARTPPPPPEIILVIGGAGDVGRLRLLLSSARAAMVRNIVLVATDDDLIPSLGADAPAESIRAAELGPLSAHAGGAGEMPRTLLKWRLVEALLGYGVGVMYLDAATVMLRDPFKSIYRDADIETMSLGWDDPSAYGYNHVIDDPSMGFTRFCHGSRIGGYEPNVFYAAPTTEAAALAARRQARLKRAGGGAAARAEREWFLQAPPR